MRAALAPFAILVLVYLPGHALLRRAARSSGSALGRLWPFPELLAGLCLTSWIAFLLAECGLFSLSLLTLLLLLVTVAPRLASRRDAPPRLTAALLAGTGIAALVSALYLPPFDTSVMASDATYHFNVGVHVAHSGGLGVADPLLAELDTPTRALLLPEWLGGRIRLAGGLFLGSLDANTAWPTFSHLLAVWIAVFEAIGGPGAGGLAGVAFAVLGAWAVCLLTAETEGWIAGTVAAVLLVTSQAQVFYGRFAMPEIVGQALLWGGVLAFVLWWRDDEPIAGVLAAAGLGMSGFARLELLAVVPLALGLQLAFAARRPPGVGAFTAIYLLLLAHALGHLALFPSHYRALAAQEIAAWEPDAGPLLMAAVAGSGAGLLAVALTASRRLGRSLGRFAALALAAAVFAVHVRGSHFAGATALGWLAEGVPWPILALAAVGLIMCSRDAREPARRLPLVLFLAAPAALLVDAHLSPVQLWGIRRFLPVTIPFVYLLAAAVVARVARRLAPGRAGAVTALLTAPVLFLNLPPVRPLLGTELFPPQATALRALAADIPPGGVVFVAPELSDFVLHVPLWLVHGRETFVLSWWNWQGELRRAAPQLLPRHRVFYLTRSDGPEPAVPPLALGLRRQTELRFVVPDPDPERAPAAARIWNVPLGLYEVTSPAATSGRPPLGHEVAVR